MALVDITEIQVGLLVLMVCLIAWKIKDKIKQDRKLPPGPWGLPLLGYLPFLGKRAHVTLTELSKKYGNIMSVQMGSWPCIVISSYPLIREASETYGTAFAGRPNFVTFQIMSCHGKGPVVQFAPYDASFKLIRKTAKECLNQFIRSKDTPVEEAMVAHAQTFAQNLIEEGSGDVCFDPSEEVGLSSSSVVYDILYGIEGHNRENEYFKIFLVALDDLVRLTTGEIDLVPWCNTVFKSWEKEYETAWKPYLTAVQKLKTAHESSYDANHIRDICDASIMVASNTPADEKMAAEMNDAEIQNSINGLLLAGTETITTQNRWSILYLIAFPKIQMRLQEEIDQVIGDRIPQYSDMRHMPYMEAFILESLRLPSQLPFLVPHLTTCDVTFEGYDIPKDTLVFFNVYACHLDPEIWKEPEEFKPERFLTDNNEINRNLSNKVSVFGYGKRRCLGQQAAMMQMFLTYVILLQECTILNVPGQELRTTSDKVDYAIVLRPQPYKIIVKARE